MTSLIDVRTAAAVRFFYLSQGLVRLHVSHMGKTNGNPYPVCERTVLNLIVQANFLYFRSFVGLVFK